MDDFAARYGLGPGRGAPAPAAPAAPARYRYNYPRRTTTTAQATSQGGLPTALDEQQLKVTLMLYAVKLLPAK